MTHHHRPHPAQRRRGVARGGSVRGEAVSPRICDPAGVGGQDHFLYKMDNIELLQLIDSPEALDNMIREALEVLRGGVAFGGGYQGQEYHEIVMCVAPS